MSKHTGTQGNPNFNSDFNAPTHSNFTPRPYGSYAGREVAPTKPARTHVPIPQRGHGGSASATKSNMDPFEVRVRFTSLLSGLNASVTSATKTAQYAIKYRDMDEDLHSCIIEQLERSQNSMNNRANIMYFLEHLCEMASRENHIDYIRMMQRDILRIVDAVAPEDGSGAANVKVVRKVLQALQTKAFLLEQTVCEIEELLNERDTSDAHIVSSPVAALSASTSSTPKPSKTAGLPQRLDMKQIEQRIEEDRERHKRQRENAWATPKAVTLPGRGAPGATDALQAASDAEFEKLWEETSELGEDDWDLYAEEAEERERCAKEWKEEFYKKHSGTNLAE